MKNDITIETLKGLLRAELQVAERLAKKYDEDAKRVEGFGCSAKVERVEEGYYRGRVDEITLLLDFIGDDSKE